MVDMAISTARDTLRARKRLAPVCLLFNEHIRTLTVLGLPTLGDDKVQATVAMQVMARQIKATDAIIICEGWMVVMNRPPGFKNPVSFKDAQRQAEKLTLVPPSQHPDRLEAVMFTVQSREGRWSGHARMLRTGNQVTFKNVEWAGGQVGRFDNVLPPTRN